MIATSEHETVLREDRAFGAFLAALADRGVVQIAGASTAVHEAFKAALARLQADEVVGPYFAHYFPSRSTGRIDELDQALVRGEAAGIVQYANPTYSRIQISLTPFETDELLSEFPEHRQVFSEAAEAFQKRFIHESW
ncbi:MAG TPA: hypothetical protein VEX86_16930 [Longimicrobium sp.]|nr:hypothetical protein [Longimicrobium sp.]